MRIAAAGLLMLHFGVTVAGAQTKTTPPVAAPARAPYLQRGDEVEKRYESYRKNLEKLFNVLEEKLKRDAPDLLPSIVPPSAVPYGYQILPGLLPNPARPNGKSKVKLSAFSWSRTESRLEAGQRKLDSLSSRLAGMPEQSHGGRRRVYVAVVAEYKHLVADQKLTAGWVQYNRLWQDQVARNPQLYRQLKGLQAVAMERQGVYDSISMPGKTSDRRLTARADSLSHVISEALRKEPTPSFVRVEHPTAHRWILAVPAYTDITDSGFVERARRAIEDTWQLHAGGDDFRVRLEMHRISPARLYSNARVPAKGEHIDVGAHLARFPANGMVLTTGANTIYRIGRGIFLGPHAVPAQTIAHEFGHVLGFKDGYFRSYADRGRDGYEILEVILDPRDVIAAPEYGLVRREHFVQVIRERWPQYMLTNAGIECCGTVMVKPTVRP